MVYARPADRFGVFGGIGQFLALFWPKYGFRNMF